MQSTRVLSDFIAVPISQGGVQGGQNVWVAADPLNDITVYVGGPDVSSANGYPLVPGAGVKTHAISEGPLWVISATPQILRVLAFGGRTYASHT